MAKNPPLNVARELGILLSGEGLETLLDELMDPGSRFTLGQAAKLFAAMEAVGAKGMDGVKDQVVGLRLHIDEEVLFEWRDPTTQTRVDSDQVKKLFPQADYPDLYKQTEVRGGTTVKLPFDKNNIGLPMDPVGQRQPAASAPTPGIKVAVAGAIVDAVNGQELMDFGQPEPFI